MSQKPIDSEVLDIEKILSVLHHRYPFLLIDRIVDIKPGKSLTAIKNVTYNEPFFQGHFPEMRVMPGVLIVEAMGQAGAVLLNHSLPDSNKKLLFLSKIEQARFKKVVIPGDQLVIKVELLRLRSRFGTVKATGTVDGDVVADCELLATFNDVE
jgi:3-hydroxyacyl-[acyl-carrier-protein] dehydratase/UDP-3-O-[3-hydroxymyristoyl] N-acetylglucosamine deacetylase/3-hydroxyacyl-[acyl-carrier-protein] dehydratase